MHTKQAGCQDIHPVHAGPLKIMGMLLIGPILKVMGILLLLVAQTSGSGSLTDFIYPIKSLHSPSTRGVANLNAYRYQE